MRGPLFECGNAKFARVPRAVLHMLVHRARKKWIKKSAIFSIKSAIL